MTFKRLVAMVVWSLLLMPLAIALSPSDSGATAIYDVVKRVTWDTSQLDRRGEVVGEETGENTGSWRYGLHALAWKSRRPPATDHEDKPAQQGADPIPVPLLVPQNDNTRPLREDPEDDERHLHWGTLNNFDQGQPLRAPPPSPPAPPEPPAQGEGLDLLGDAERLREAERIDPDAPEGGGLDRAKAVAGMNNATAEVELLTNRPPFSGRPRHLQDAITHIFGRADAGEPGLAEAFSAGEITLTGEQEAVQLFDLMNPENSRALDKRTQGRLLGGGLQERGKKPIVRYVDPLELIITDAGTGELIAQEQLYRETWRAEGEASVEWGSDGLILTAGENGRASIVMETLSDWILNPFIGGAFLVGDAFSATGDLFGLNWVITSLGELTAAILPLSELDPTFRFDVLPSGLGDPLDPINDVNLTLLSHADGRAEEVVVPEPSSLVLLAAGLLSLMLYLYPSARRKLDN